MAEELPPPNLDGLVASFVEQLYDPAKLKRLEKAMGNAHAAGETVAAGADVAARASLAEDVEAAKGKFQQLTGGISAWIMGLAIEQAFDVPVDNAAFFRLGASGDRRAVSRAIASKMVLSLTGGATSIEPSADPAARYLDVVIGQVFESWAVGSLVEIGSAIVPFLEQIQTVGDIGNRVVGALGIGDSSSRVLRPYIDTLVVEPLRRYIDKTYRPAQLSATDAARQILRGFGDAEFWRNEMRTLGFSEDRIEAIINSQKKLLSPEQLSWMEWNEVIPFDEAIQTMREQGYDEQNASKQLIIKRLQNEDQISRRIASDAMTAYENWLVDKAELRRFLDTSVSSKRERDLLVNAADARRALNRKRLSSNQVAQLVRAGISTYREYREALRREGYPDDDALALELLLRHDLDEKAEIEKLRAQAYADRADEKKTRDAERVATRAELAAQRALKRRGPAADLERAVIRGLIPFSRYEEVLRAQYDDDTVAILVDLVEDDRQRYLDQQSAADEAKKRAGRRNLDTSSYEQAVMEGVLTLDEYRQQLARLGFSAPDVDVLSATLASKKSDRDDARAARKDAELAARKKSIDLNRFEQLVRRGVRSFAEYDALLVSLAFDEPARAAMRELLQLRVADDAAAADARAAGETRLAAKGVSVEQFRRAVLRGDRTIADFEQFLVQQNFTADAQTLILAELRDALNEADAARTRREQAEAEAGSRPLPLATVRRAVQLGTIGPDAYQMRLVDAGYTPDDIAIEMELLVAEIADVQAARARRDTLNASSAARGLSLGQVESAVKSGTASVEDYRTRAFNLGYAPADVNLLVGTLERELATFNDAKARRLQIVDELAAQGVVLDELESAVLSHQLTLNDFSAALTELGYSNADAELLVALLVQRLNAKATTTEPTGGGN